MDRLIYTAMTGANAAASRQAVLSNNLANVSTNGFRAQLATYRAVPLLGEGATTRVFAVEATAGHLNLPGPAQRTGRSLDAMAMNDAWFAVQGLDGTEAYTRMSPATAARCCPAMVAPSPRRPAPNSPSARMATSAPR
jgi:flagellar basal-body rod protein FlgF